jgi:glycerate 2-kinase
MAAAFTQATTGLVRSVVIAGPPPAQPPEMTTSYDWFDAGHPLPNDASARAGERALAIAAEDHQSTLVLLLSGGASAMLASPVEGIALDDKVRTARSLMQAGVSIDALNVVRKHLSSIKGGQLAAAAGDSLTLAISDVHGPVPDDPSVIGSGPTVADPSTYSEALAYLHRIYSEVSADIPRSVLRHLERGANGELRETPKPGDMRLLRAQYHVIGNRTTAMDGAAAAARELGYTVSVLPNATVGEARLAGARFAAEAMARARGAKRGRLCVIASGETTVRVRGGGHGGRNQEFALGMAATLREELRARGLSAAGASAGTDGIDGPTDAAGALVDASTLDRAAAEGLDPDDALARNDSHPFFQRLGDLLIWGPTGTNVGDIHLFLTR